MVSRRSSIPTPWAHLRNLETSARADPAAARIALGLIDSIAGTRDTTLLPYPPALGELEQLPARCRTSAREILDWGSHREIQLRDLTQVREAVAAALIRHRRDSPYGRRRLRIANRICAEYPRLKPDLRCLASNPQVLCVFGDEIGQPLGDGTIRRLLALSPSRIEVRRSGDAFYAASIERAACIQLAADGYSIERISMTVSVEPAEKRDPILGILDDYFETGTEGVIWSVYDEDERGYAGLHSIEEGDHLTILDQLERRLWAGTIHCDRNAGYRRYSSNPKFGQPCALGRWVHWTQRGFEPDDWARFFIRPAHDRYRGILRKRAKPPN